MNTETKTHEPLWDKSAFVVPANNIPDGIPIDLADLSGLTKLEYATLKAMQGDLAQWGAATHSTLPSEDNQIKSRGAYWVKCAVSALKALDGFREKNTPSPSQPSQTKEME